MLTAILAPLFATGLAHAQETIEIGVIRNEDITVVQKMLYPKVDRSEFGFHVGVMPFDPYLTTPNGQITFTRHLSNSVGFSTVIGGGYGFKTNVYKLLESPTFGVAPYAYRYLGALLMGIEYCPIYAKMNLNGAKVYHFDLYGVARGGLTVEQSVLPDGDLAFGPTLSPGLGMRLFLGKNTALRVEFRDDVLLERREITQSTHIKQNANVTLGLVFLSKVEGR
jgi:outer membrane beta-barrel protein